MADNDSASDIKSGGKKLLENRYLSNFMVPVAILLVGALIIFGVTKMLSTERTYRDLVREMQSKTFGNRWIAAFELSKLLAAKKIPEEEYPWLIENLTELYKSTIDARTKNFIVVSAGNLKTESSKRLLEMALAEKDGDVVMSAIAAVGDLPQGSSFNWENLLVHLDSEDVPIRHATILVLGTHRVMQANKKIEVSLNHHDRMIRYAAATALVYFKNDAALPFMKEILLLDAKTAGVSEEQSSQLKHNILRALQNEKWPVLREELSRVAEQDGDLKLRGIAKEVLESFPK